MKLAKTIRSITTVALLTMTAISIYSSVKAKDMYREMKASCNELKGRMSDMRTTINSLSNQIDAHKEKLDQAFLASLNDVKSDKYGDSDDQVSVDAKVEETFTVREYKGIVGIFDANGDLVREENIMVSTLSPSDRQNLELGIRVLSKEELEDLVEDLK